MPKVFPHLALIAHIAHEANRAYCNNLGDNLGDLSQLHWEDAPEWQKKSAISGAEFHLSNPDAGDSASHDHWLKDKVADGWVYGPVKDPAQKEHPCLVPFDQLPAEQQLKDALFRRIVHAAALALSVDNQQANERVAEDGEEDVGECGCGCAIGNQQANERTAEKESSQQIQRLVTWLHAWAEAVFQHHRMVRRSMDACQNGVHNRLESEADLLLAQVEVNRRTMEGLLLDLQWGQDTTTTVQAWLKTSIFDVIMTTPVEGLASLVEANPHIPCRVFVEVLIRRVQGGAPTQKEERG